MYTLICVSITPNTDADLDKIIEGVMEKNILTSHFHGNILEFDKLFSLNSLLSEY